MEEWSTISSTKDSARSLSLDHSLSILSLPLTRLFWTPMLDQSLARSVASLISLAWTGLVRVSWGQYGVQVTIMKKRNCKTLSTWISSTNTTMENVSSTKPSLISLIERGRYKSFEGHKKVIYIFADLSLAGLKVCPSWKFLFSCYGGIAMLCLPCLFHKLWPD